MPQPLAANAARPACSPHGGLQAHPLRQAGRQPFSLSLSPPSLTAEEARHDLAAEHEARDGAEEPARRAEAVEVRERGARPRDGLEQVDGRYFSVYIVVTVWFC